MIIIGAGLLVFGRKNNLESILKIPHYKIKPRLSEELKKRLISTGNYENFLRDYSNLYHNFMPQKLKLPARGEKYRKKQELSEEEKKQLEKLGRDYAATLHQLLELGVLLNKSHKEYAIIGGFGVLGHMIKHNPKFITKFRGTEDIDILSKDNLSNYFREIGYRKVPTERVDLSTIPDKRLDTYIKENPITDSALKIQDRKTIALNRINATSKVMKNKKKVNFYGIPIWVADSESLIKAKRTGRTRKDKLGSLKDLYDQRQLDLIREYEKSSK
jgi:hypothetical protein